MHPLTDDNLLIRDSTAMARSHDLARLFQQPDSPAQRHYEVCRAYFLEGSTAQQLAQRFQLHIGTVRALVHDFASHPDINAFFKAGQLGRKTAPKRQAIQETAGALRRQGATLTDIHARLQREGFDVSESYLFRVLRRAGVTETRNRRPAPQPGELARDGSEVPDVADVRALSLKDGRRFSTKVAGLFVFLPMLLELDLPAAVATAELPGSEQIPPLQALLALLTPKLLGKRRVSHISDLCCDEGAGMFAGLNVLPKTTFATDYSYKTGRAMTERLVAAVIGKTALGDPPLSFNLDFHAIPFRGAEPDLESHWVAMRNRALPAVMAFVAQADRRRVICYATANLLRDEADAMVPRFADYWKEQTGHYPARLLFDSRATTYAGLNGLTRREVGFITIRRRGSGMLERVRRLSTESWEHCQVTQAKGKRRQIRYVDERVRLDGYDSDLRQLIVTGLGHESPTFVLTNDLPKPQTAREVIQTYASRNHVENHLGEQITFFHLDCLCSDVRLNVDFDLTLTVLADLLYRKLAERLKGFARAGPGRLFRKFVDTPGVIEITAEGVIVRLSKRAHNPLLKEAGVTKPTRPVPWLGNRSVHIIYP
jgi:transposase